MTLSRLVDETHASLEGQKVEPGITGAKVYPSKLKKFMQSTGKCVDSGSKVSGWLTRSY